jgi:hypothetical protein
VKREKLTVLRVMILLIILLTTGCNLPNSGQNLTVDEMVATAQQQTLDAGGGDDSSSDQSNNDITPTETLQPTVTLTPTVTMTPTQEKPMVSVSVDTNCRVGPGKIYDWIGALLVGEQAEVTGQSMDGQYWVIKNPDQSGECWLWGNYATVTGPITALPKYTPPPTPTPAFVWEGSWTTYAVPTSGPTETYTMEVAVSDQNFTGVMDLGGGSTAQLTGTISDDNLSVSGNWVSPGPSGTFEFFAFGINQFQGNGDNGTETFGWCGSRGGAGQPSPCYKP